MYTTAQQLLDRFDATRLAQLAAPNDTEVTADLFALTITVGDRSAYSPADIAKADAALARLSASIVRADKLIDSYIEKHRTLPLDQAVIDDSPLPTFSMDLAIYDLSGAHTTEDEERRRNEAVMWLRDFARGINTLGEQDDTAGGGKNHIVKSGVSNNFDWCAY